MKRSPAEKFKAALRALKRLLRRKLEPPDDPYAYVGAPVKPRPPHRSAAAAEPLD